MEMPTNGGKKLRFIEQNDIFEVIFVSSSVHVRKNTKKFKILQKSCQENARFCHFAEFSYLCARIINRVCMKKFFFLAVLALCAVGIAMTGCNVTRTITNESKYIQRGDTSIVIQTKTIETYDASKKGL